MKKCLSKILFIAVVLLTITLSNNKIVAQQLPQYTQYMFTQMAYNPAYVGSKDGINIETAFRFQWVGLTDLEGIPMTQSVGAHLAIPLLRSGIGLNISNDMLGAERNTSLHLMYAFRQKIGNSAYLAIGLEAGAIQKSLDGGQLLTPTGTYNQGIDHNDALLPTVTSAGFAIDGGAGLYLQTNKMRLGLSAKHLLEPKVSFTTPTRDIEIQFKRHFLVSAAYDLPIGNTITLSPAFLVKSDFNKYQGDLTVLLTYNDNIRGGLAFRGIEPDAFDAVSFMAGMDIGRSLMLGYAYDLPISGLKSFTTGSHEFVLHYKFRNVLPSSGGKTIHNPRFL